MSKSGIEVVGVGAWEHSLVDREILPSRRIQGRCYTGLVVMDRYDCTDKSDYPSAFARRHICRKREKILSLCVWSSYSAY